MAWVLGTLTCAPVGAAPLPGARIAQPLLVTATVCALPSTSCPRPDEVIRFVVDGAERQVGFTNLRVLQGSVTAGEIFSELRVRPGRLFGPEDELAKLRAGAPLRMRAVVRVGARYVFLESLEAIAEETGE